MLGNAIPMTEALESICCGPPQTINGKEPLMKCVGDACMAWRWKETHAGIGALRESRGYGFCGLAGEPKK